MGEWVRNNLVLIAGIVLPVLLVAGFLVLQGLPRTLSDPPKYDFLVVGYHYDANRIRGYHLTFEVRDGGLEGRATPARDPNPYANRQHATLYRYSVEDHAFTEINWELPDGLDDITEPVNFPVGEVANLRLDKSGRSPDAYFFEHIGYRGRGGLLGEIFGYSRRHDNPYVLNKNGALFTLPNPPSSTPYYGQQLQFLGWVLESDEGS